MTKPELPDPIEPPDLIAITKAIRFAIVCVVLGISYFNIRSALSLDKFAQIFADMFGPAKPLPALTELVLRSPMAVLALSALIPALAVSTLLSRGLVRPFYALGALTLASLAFLVVLFHALSAPLNQIVTGMTGG
jgi:hypothetical protein